MIKNYIKIAWRNLVRNKTFSAINIAGLAIGMSSSLLIMLWVQDERSVDAFHTNGNRLYQVYERQYNEGKVEAGYLTQGLLADELKRLVPEIEFATGLERTTPASFEAGNKINRMEGTFAGEEFFNMFSYKLLEGNPATALNRPEAIAVSRKMAEYFFGSSANAIGKTIINDTKDNLLITAVFENLSANSSLQFDFLRSWKAYIATNQWVNNWSNTSPFAFVQLKKNADVSKAEAGIKDFIQRYIPKTNDTYTELALQPYTDRYLHSVFANGKISGGRIEYVRLFSLVAVFILVIACINFMNLATARSVKRAKEVGIRKVVGALRSTLTAQFIGEAIVLAFFSAIVAVSLAAIILPFFNELTGKQLSLPFIQPGFWLALASLIIITGFVAGSYPAVFLSSLNPIRVLKGSLRFGRTAVFFRKGLVVFQFTLSIILMISMIVIYRQMEYAQSKNLGYDRENLIYIPAEGELVTKFNLFKQQASGMPGILSISKMRESPTVIDHHIGDLSWTGKDPNLATSFADAVVGYDFVKTMKLKMKEGEDFSKVFGTDSVGFLLNESAVQKIGYKDPVVGQRLRWGQREGKIIGVMKDFHFNSMHRAIEPLVIRLDENQKWATILVRTEAGKTKQAIASLEKIAKAVNPRIPFSYQFSDQEYSKLYNSEQLVSRLANIFAFLAIFISCLGLFGMATFMASQRVKEIGVRKVLGASVPGIVRLLSFKFLQPVALALVIAFPLAGYIMNNWLADFAYRVKLEWWVFALAALLTMGIALLTVSYQSIKASLRNPVRSLRTE